MEFSSGLVDGYLGNKLLDELLYLGCEITKPHLPSRVTNPVDRYDLLARFGIAFPLVKLSRKTLGR